MASISAASLSAPALKLANTRAQTPLFAQRLNRLWVFSQSPKRSGRSRQGMPARYRYSTAPANSRLSRAAPPTCPTRPGSTCSIRAHWSSRNPYRRVIPQPFRASLHRSSPYPTTTDDTP